MLTKFGSSCTMCAQTSRISGVVLKFRPMQVEIYCRCDVEWVLLLDSCFGSWCTTSTRWTVTLISYHSHVPHLVNTSWGCTRQSHTLKAIRTSRTLMCTDSLTHYTFTDSHYHSLLHVKPNSCLQWHVSENIYCTEWLQMKHFQSMVCVWMNRACDNCNGKFDLWCTSSQRRMLDANTQHDTHSPHEAGLAYCVASFLFAPTVMKRRRNYESSIEWSLTCESL